MIERLKLKIAAIEALSREELEEVKKDLPRDYDVLRGMQLAIAKEFDFLVDAALVEGLRGNLDQALLYHKLSFQCLQINGMLMEHARGEGPMEHYMESKRK